MASTNARPQNLSKARAQFTKEDLLAILRDDTDWMRQKVLEYIQDLHNPFEDRLEVWKSWPEMYWETHETQFIHPDPELNLKIKDWLGYNDPNNTYDNWVSGGSSDRDPYVDLVNFPEEVELSPEEEKSFYEACMKAGWWVCATY